MVFLNAGSAGAFALANGFDQLGWWRKMAAPPLGRVGRVALALIGKYLMEEVTSNLHRLKELLESTGAS